MASEVSLIEGLLNSRNRDLSVFLPLIFTNSGPESDPEPDHDLENPDQETQDPTRPGSSRDRVVLVNPLTQGMVVIGGGSLGFDSLLNDLMRRDSQPPASKASIDAMPSVEIESLGGECVICLEEWGVGDVAKEMPCEHKFHGGCVEKWLKIHGSCPICRYKMPVLEEQDFDKKNWEEIERGGRRREIWFTFSFNGERSNEEQRSNQESNEEQRLNQEESNDSSSL